MVRTQIQLSEGQVASLRTLAAERSISMAEIIRQAVEAYLATFRGAGTQELRARAIAAAGRFRSGVTDLSEAHDRHLDEAYE